jgi:hypothetical protein
MLSFLCFNHQRPKSEVLDYLLEPAKEISDSDKEEFLIFCLDISGSMCVTTEVPGTFKLKGNRTSQLNSLNTDAVDQYESFLSLLPFLSLSLFVLWDLIDTNFS